MKKVDYEITAGDTFKSHWYYIEDVAGDIVDLSTFTLTWGAKKTTDGGYIVSTMPLNVVKNTTTIEIDGVDYLPNTCFYFTLTPTQTTNLSDTCNNTSIMYDVQVLDDINSIFTIIKGNLQILRQITI